MTAMKERIRAGVFSPNDNRAWVRSDNLDLMLRHEAFLIDALTANGIEVIRGGKGFAREDQIAWNRDLVVRQARRIAEAKPDVLILNQGSWTFPRDSVDAVDVYESTLRDVLQQNQPVPSRLLLFGYKDTQVPGLVALMAIAGALRTMGKSFQIAYGRIDEDEAALKDVLDKLRFFKRRALAAETVSGALARLPEQKYLQFGGESLRMPTATADPNLWQKLFKVSYDHRDQSEMVDRALAMVEWSGKPGESEFRIVDARVRGAVEYKQKTGNFDFSRASLPSIHKFVMQVAMFYAARDIIKETGSTFCGIKCQDELSANICTACIATSYLGNEVAPDGSPQERIYPTSCENDMDTALTQLLLHLLSGRPAAFGDFRDVEDGTLTIVNCGQHPTYFYGTPEEPGQTKDLRAEFLGQEIFYAGGGASVRGRTPGGLQVTVARLGRENMRYYVAATVVETVDVDPTEHERYNVSWPVLRGKIPMSERALASMWPSNHLAFTFGDYTPHLVELAEQLGLGYRIVDAAGNEHGRPS
jgi:L-fucose isomerase-like protein